MSMWCRSAPSAPSLRYFWQINRYRWFSIRKSQRKYTLSWVYGKLFLLFIFEYRPNMKIIKYFWKINFFIRLAHFEWLQLVFIHFFEFRSVSSGHSHFLFALEEMCPHSEHSDYRRHLKEFQWSGIIDSNVMDLNKIDSFFSKEIFHWKCMKYFSKILLDWSKVLANCVNLVLANLLIFTSIKFNSRLHCVTSNFFICSQWNEHSSLWFNIRTHLELISDSHGNLHS